MKKLVSGIALMLALGVGAQAQVKDSVKIQHGRHAMNQRLNLSQDQRARLKAINEQQKKEFSALANSGIKDDALKAKRKELHEKHRSQTEMVFSPEQKQQLAKMRSERTSVTKGKHKMHHKGGERFKNLDLTVAQQDQMRKLRAESKERMQSLKNDNALSVDQRKAQMKEVHKTQMEKFKSILTPEQRSQLQSSRKPVR